MLIKSSQTELAAMYLPVVAFFCLWFIHLNLFFRVECQESTTMKPPTGSQYRPIDDAYHFETINQWADSWQERFQAVKQKIPTSYVVGAYQEARRQRARNLADYIESNYGNQNKRDYYLNKTGAAPYSYMLAQEGRLYRLGINYLPLDFVTFKCGSGPYTTPYCGQLRESSSSNGNNG